MRRSSLGMHRDEVWAMLLWMILVFDGGLLGVSYAAEPPLEELEQIAFRRAAAVASESVVQVETFGGAELVNRQFAASGPSTGSILSSDGWIITSSYPFRNQPASINVILSDGERKPARLVARDYSRELALLKIEVDRPLVALQPSDRKGWRVGQWVLALGKTFEAKEASCSVGILSAMGRVWNKAVQTDAKVSPQNYGGPLIDLDGRAIGILTPINPGIVSEGEVEQWYDSGIGFAIPLEDILARLSRMQGGEDLYSGKIGVRWRGADEYGESVVLQGVTPGSPAAKVGIEVGDQITAGGPTAEALIPVRNHSEFKHILGPADAGGRIVLEVERGGEKRRVECELVKELPSYREPYLGILIEPGTESKSPLVRGVIPESPAQRAGIEVGERIELIGGQGITEDRSLDVRLGNLNYREAVPVVLKRGDGTTRELSVALVAHPENDIEWEDRLEVPAVGEEGEVKGVQVGVGTVQLPLGDVKNKAFAIVPSTYREDVAHGLLVIYADAGEQDQKQWSEAWEAFAREHRWIVAVAQSAGETGWTFEELEIGNRVQNWVTSTYSIDRRRIVSGGIGSGSLLAYITAAQTPELFRGVWLCNGKMTARVRVLPSEPFKAAHYFVNGTDKGVEAFVERLRQNGYSVQSSSSDLESSKLVESPLLGPLQRWMRLLEAY
jgi:serine protease Do